MEQERSQLARIYTDGTEADDLFLRGWQSFWKLSKGRQRRQSR